MAPRTMNTMATQMGIRPRLPSTTHSTRHLAINELHVEAGPRLNGALIQAGLVDEWLLYLAPKLLGQGRPLADWAGVTRLAEAPALRFTSVEPVGPDLRLLARPA